MIQVIDRDGVERDIDVKAGKTLMPQLRPLKLGIVGLCNGNMACGTCHVYIEPDRLDELEPPEEDEEEMLADLSAKKLNSRLTCQIVYEDSLDDLVMTVAPRN